VEGAVGERSGDPVAPVVPSPRPDPELAERPTRFTGEYKLRMLA
jgi:hypothetical protein